MEKKFFETAIKLARKASKCGEVPIGAVIVYHGKILSNAYNLREKKHDITAHAEILAIKKAAKRLKRWNLCDCELYVTLRPCSMCNNVINQSRIKSVYYLCEKLDYKKEYNRTNYSYCDLGELTSDYLKILKAFFSNKR